MAQISKRKSGYLIRVSCGYSADGTKQITQSMTWKPPRAGMTEKQIQKELNKVAAEFEEQCSRGQVVNSEKFETFCEAWFEVYAERKLKKSNIELCREYTKRVYEKLGHIRIDRITPRDIDQFSIWLSKQEVKSDIKAIAKISLQDIMDKKGLNQKQLAELSQLSPHTIKDARINHQIRWASAEKIAAALDMKTSDIFAKIRGDKLLSAKTVKNYISFVSSVFDYAVKVKAIKENPCKNAVIPKVEQPEHKMFTVDQAKQFLDILDLPETPVKYRAFFQLAMFGGFRKGEILGLEWSDIDFDTNIVHIRRTLHHSKGLYYDTTPKTKTSIRDLKMPDGVMFTLRQLHNYQNSQHLMLGDAWHSTERLFTTWDGHQMCGSTPSSWLTKTCEAHDLPKVNLHSFRHLNASLLISSGVDVKTVQSVLGHSQASTTLDIYAAAFRDREAQALGVVADILTDGKQRKAE